MSQTSNTQTQGALLKELYTLPPVRVLNDKSFVHDKITKETAQLDFSGEHIRWPVTVQRSLGRGSRSEGTGGAELPVAISEVDVEATATCAFHYYALEWTEALEEVSKNKEGAFESAVARKMKNVATDMAKELNRQWYNASSSGVLATVSGTGASSATQAVDSVQFIQVGDSLDVYNGSTLVGTRTVSSVNKADVEVTFDSTIDLSAVSNATIHVTGNRGNEIEGLRHIAAASRTLHGIDSATYDSWGGAEFSAAGAIAGEDLLEQLYDRVGEKGRGDIDTMIATRGIRRRLAAEFAAQRRYLNEKALDVKMGYRMVDLTVGGSPVEMVIDDDAPKGNVIAFAKDALRIMQLTKPGFLETEAGDGAVVELKDSTTPGRKVAAWQSWYRYHCNLVSTDPARTGKITACEDDAVA